MAREETDVGPILLKCGVALALFLAGLLYHRIRTRRVKPKLPPSTGGPSDRSGDAHSQVDAATMTRTISETGSTSNDTSGALFDVFLSFRGPDTRENFTDTLYYALLDKGIRVFIDKKGIDVGDEIGPEIYQAIDDSKVCIPIFSTGYASSRWCLRELEHMMKRRKTHGLEVMPIFYDVEPSVVKLETGAYRDALTQHKRERGAETVQGWEEALKEVTKIKGWDTKNTGHGKLARQIALEVLGKLKVSPVRLPDLLVSIDKSVDKVIDMLSVESKDIKLVGICGIGGIGKTTLAKVVYDKLSTHFQSCSFILDIRQASESSSFGLLDVQRQLVRDILGDKRIEISNIEQGKNMIEKYFSEKKVLIFLDDLNDGKQLRALAAESKWFGSGSRILVTTRDKKVLSVFENNLTYEVEELDIQESLELFSKHAFGRNFHFPPSDFLNLSIKAIAKAGGLPLTIEVIGSLLRGQEEAGWEEILEKMENYSHEEVLQPLMSSYKALDRTQKQIFLDIACFLAGKNRRDATYMWKDCKLFPIEGIQILLSRSLVKIRAENELWMHDQLKDLGRSIVLAENEEDPGQRSRVWNHKEALDMITRKKGTETVEAICVYFDGISLTSEEFKKMPKIKFLEMIGENLSGDFKDLFPKLRWLSWRKCPSNLQATNFCPEKLLVLDLSWTGIKHDWDGWTQLKVATRLKVLDLSGCRKLSITPDLSTYISLEILILRDCKSLLTIHRSIGRLRRLKHLNLNGCSQLQVLPDELGSLEALTELLIENYYFYGSISQVPSSIGALVNLERLVICGAIKLTTLPDSIGTLKGLAELDVSKTGIAELPNAIVNLKSLKVLRMNKSRMQKLPEAIGELVKLEEIYGEYCACLEMIPSDIGRLPSLKILKLTETRVKDVPELPQSLVSLCLSSIASENAPEISNLVSLRNLDLCFPSERILFAFSGGVETYSPWCWLELPSITSISSYMGCFCCLKELKLSGCENLRHIRQLPSSLRKLTVEDCNLLEVFDLSNLESLLELSLDEINILDLEGLTSLQRLSVWGCKSSNFNGLERLENLQFLSFRDCGSLQALPDLSNLKNLKDFGIQQCPKLVEIEDLDKLESLERLRIDDCSLQTLPDLSNLKNLKDFDVGDCPKLVEIEGLDKLESLERLSIKWCSLKTLPDLSNFKNLKDFEIQMFLKLVEVEGLDKLESLESLSISRCSLQTSPGLSNFKNLKDFEIQMCPELVEIEGLDKLKSLERLQIDDWSHQTLPDLSNLKNLKDLKMQRCSELVEIEGLDKLESLERLSINGRSLRTLPDLSNLKNLKVFELWNCSKLVEIKGLDKLESLETLEIGCCSSLRSIPDLSHLKKLKKKWCDAYPISQWSTRKSL